MPFGLRNAAQSFQRLNEALRELPHSFAYIDDLLIASKDTNEHIDHVTQVFERLNHFGLKVNPDKCVFARVRVSFSRA